MENSFEILDDLFVKIKDYFLKRSHLFKMELADHLSKIISGCIMGIIIAFFLCCSIIFSCIGLSLIIGQILNEPFFGFLIVGFLFWLTALLVWKFRRKKIRKQILNFLLGQIFNNE